jgi:hypothetical protein
MRAAITAVSDAFIVTMATVERYHPEVLGGGGHGLAKNPPHPENIIDYNHLCYIQSATHL